jgi:hypothetical protein
LRVREAALERATRQVRSNLLWSLAECWSQNRRSPRPSVLLTRHRRSRQRHSSQPLRLSPPSLEPGPCRPFEPLALRARLPRRRSTTFPRKIPRISYPPPCRLHARRRRPSAHWGLTRVVKNSANRNGLVASSGKPLHRSGNREFGIICASQEHREYLYFHPGSCDD